jgi:hypothetical protein
MTGGPKATLRVCRSKGISHLTVSHGASLALHSRRQKPRCPVVPEAEFVPLELLSLLERLCVDWVVSETFAKELEGRAFPL